jgi:hypothetical protein
MTPENVSAALEIMKARGIPHDEAMDVLSLVVQKMNDEKVLAKAKRTGLTVEQVRGMDLGKSAASDLNAKLGYGRKS